MTGRNRSERPSAALALVACLLLACTSDAEVNAEDPTAGATDAGGGRTDASGAPDAGAAFEHPREAAPGDAATEGPLVTYTNPVMERDFPDPYVLRAGDAYYAFGTNAAGSNVQAAVSSDLRTWTSLPDALPALPSWAAKGKGLTWAPAVLQRGSTYVLYYTARDLASDFQCIGRAVAPRPEGPYVDTSTGPLVCQVRGASALCGSIDPSPFVDAGGAPYLLWKSDENASACRTPPRLFSQPLSDDGMSVIGLPRVLLTRDQSWEGEIIEGPSMIESGGVHYLFYSANWYASGDYAIGYARCDSPLGPCTKVSVDAKDAGAPAPLVHSRGAALGPGGQEFFTDTRSRTWMAYHAWSAPLTSYDTGGVRSLRIDPISFTAGGAAMIDAPSSAPRSY